MEALPIFLEALTSSWGAILISVTLILLFGEIVPQSVCTRYGLSVGATMAPVVRVLVWFCFPIAFPISKILDYMLGDSHIALLHRSGLQALVKMHGNEAGKGGELSHRETAIIAGALELAGKTVLHAMTPISETFSLDIDEKLDREKMTMILEKGHSRVPVYHGQPTNIIGVILVKSLLTIDPTKETTIRSVAIRKIPRVSTKMPLYDILNEFRKGQSHMALVVKFLEEKQALDRSDDMKAKINQSPREEEEGFSGEDEKVVGIITMEDVIEEILQEEILDETDIATTSYPGNML